MTPVPTSAVIFRTAGGIQKDVPPWRNRTKFSLNVEQGRGFKDNPLPVNNL